MKATTLIYRLFFMIFGATYATMYVAYYAFLRVTESPFMPGFLAGDGALWFTCGVTMAIFIDLAIALVMICRLDERGLRHITPEER